MKSPPHVGSVIALASSCQPILHNIWRNCDDTENCRYKKVANQGGRAEDEGIVVRPG